MKVLVIDDNPDTTTFLTAWLEDEGYDTSFANTSKEGMALILRERPAVVLMDVKMPHQTGLQLYREIQRNEALQGTKVIFITGVAEFQIYGNGCSKLPPPAAIIDKPIDLKALRAAIEEACANNTAEENSRD